MARVFKNAADLIHIWANQAQDEGCSSSMSFRYAHIYSDAMMIASFRTDDAISLSFRSDDVVFFDSRSISSTTSGHQSAVKSACGALTVVEYNCIPKWCGDEVATLDEDPCDVEPSEIWKQYRDIWFILLASAADKRFKRTASQRLVLAWAYAEKANNMATLFDLEDSYTLSAA